MSLEDPEDPFGDLESLASWQTVEWHNGPSLFHLTRFRQSRR